MALNSSIVAALDQATPAQYNNLRKDVIEQAGEYIGTPGGTGDAITLNVDNQVTAYAAGQTYVFKAGAANTGATTINVESLGAKTIKKHNDQDLAANDIESGMIVVVKYDGTNMQMLNPPATQMSTANSATLTNASNADALHIHKYAKRLATFVTNVVVSNSTTDTNLLSFTLGANELGSTGIIQGRIYFSEIDLGSGTLTVSLKLGSTTIASVVGQSATLTNSVGYVDFTIIGAGATNSQEGSITAVITENKSTIGALAGLLNVGSGTAAEDTTSSKTVAVSFAFSIASVSNNMTAVHGFAMLITNP